MLDANINDLLKRKPVCGAEMHLFLKQIRPAFIRAETNTDKSE